MELVHFGGEAGWIMLYASSDLAIPLQTITKRDFALLGCRLMVNRIHKPWEFVSLQSHAHAMLERERMESIQVWSKIQTIYEIARNGTAQKIAFTTMQWRGCLASKQKCAPTLQWKHAENSKLYVNAHAIKLNSFDKNKARFFFAKSFSKVGNPLMQCIIA